MTALALAAARHGSGGVPLVIVHGLFGSGRNWGRIAKGLSNRGEVVAVDMRNHGGSPWDDAHDYLAMAEDLADVAAWPFDLLGHSMGGKAAMVLALTQPGAVGRLVVADIAPMAYGHTQAGYVAAMQAVDPSLIGSRADADAVLAGAIPEREIRAFLLQSLDIAGGRWRLNLDALGARMPDIMGWPDIDGRFDGPCLFLIGGDSDYVGPEGRDRIAALFPKATFAEVEGAGHWLHAEKPREVEAAVRAFLDA